MVLWLFCKNLRLKWNILVHHFLAYISHYGWKNLIFHWFLPFFFINKCYCPTAQCFSADLRAVLPHGPLNGVEFPLLVLPSTFPIFRSSKPPFYVADFKVYSAIKYYLFTTLFQPTAPTKCSITVHNNCNFCTNLSFSLVDSKSRTALVHKPS